MNRILGNLGKTDINEKKIKITLMDGIQKKKVCTDGRNTSLICTTLEQ